MKIRYYLRGLGIGILVTALFFMISDKPSQTMSDEMIKTRAKELGMTESTVLADLSVQKNDAVEETEPETAGVIGEENSSDEVYTESVEDMTQEETFSETATEESIVESETVTEEPAVSTVEETVTEQAVTEEDTQETVEEKEEENVTQDTESVSIMVNRGDGSDTVSRRLQEAGLVADAYEYDRYLMTNGYDKRIGAGEHIIPTGSTWEEIAGILCN